MAAREVVLAEQGRARHAVVIAPEADRVVRFAARELARYLGRMSGATFSIRRRSSRLPGDAAAVYLGAGDRPEFAGWPVDPSPDPFDGFAIAFRGEDILIRGHNPRSVLYGVYALLEDLGCGFFEPGIERVPARRRLTLRGRSRTETAAFPLRTVYPNLDEFKKNVPFTGLDRKVLLPQIDWMAKRRLNHYVFYINYYRYDLWERHKHRILEDMRDRGFDIEVTHHSIQYFCPPDANHDFGDYGPSTYLQNHPDWHLPGLEVTGRNTWQTAVEKPAVQRVIIDRFLAYLDRNPEVQICGLWPADIPINRPYPRLSHTDGYMRFWNAAGRAAAAAFPEKRVAVIGYFELADPPRRVTPRRNLHCWFCPISRNLAFPIDDRRNRTFLRQQTGWIAAMPPYQTANFEYYGWQMPMKPNRLAMQSDLPVYRELGLGGIYGWSGFENSVMGGQWRWAIDMHALAHLLWDPDTRLAKLDAAWAHGVFGPAGAAVLEFHDALKRVYAREAARGLSPVYEWIALDVVHRAQKILARARRAADTDARRRRVDLLEKFLCRGATEDIRRTGRVRVR